MHVIPLDATGERHLMDREALAAWLSLSEITVRRHCKPIKVDPATGRRFYDAEACAERLATVKPRVKPCGDGVRRLRRA